MLPWQLHTKWYLYVSTICKQSSGWSFLSKIDSLLRPALKLMGHGWVANILGIAVRSEWVSLKLVQDSLLPYTPWINHFAINWYFPADSPQGHACIIYIYIYIFTYQITQIVHWKLHILYSPPNQPINNVFDKKCTTIFKAVKLSLVRLFILNFFVARYAKDKNVKCKLSTASGKTVSDIIIYQVLSMAQNCNYSNSSRFVVFGSGWF